MASHHRIITYGLIAFLGTCHLGFSDIVKYYFSGRFTGGALSGAYYEWQYAADTSIELFQYHLGDNFANSWYHPLSARLLIVGSQSSDGAYFLKDPSKASICLQDNYGTNDLIQFMSGGTNNLLINDFGPYSSIIVCTVNSNLVQHSPPMPHPIVSSTDLISVWMMYSPSGSADSDSYSLHSHIVSGTSTMSICTSMFGNSPNISITNLSPASIVIIQRCDDLNASNGLNIGTFKTDTTNWTDTTATGNWKQLFYRISD